MNDLNSLFISKKDTDTQRVCGTCGKLKPTTEFYKDGLNSKGEMRYRRDCVTCYKSTRMREQKLKQQQGGKLNGNQGGTTQKHGR